jgi:hypothetical protein
MLTLNRSTLSGSEGKKYKFYTFQHFNREDAVYSQVFFNKSKDNIWSQKLNFSLKNMEIRGIKNHRKPINLKIKPGK